MSQCTNLHPFSALGFLKKVVHYDLENPKNEENYFTWTCLHSKLCTFFPEVAMSVGTVDIKMVVKLVIFGSDAGFWDFPIFVRFSNADDENENMRVR